MSEPPDLDDVRFAAATPEVLARVTGLLGSMKLPAEDISTSGLPVFELALDREGLANENRPRIIVAASAEAGSP